MKQLFLLAGVSACLASPAFAQPQTSPPVSAQPGLPLDAGASPRAGAPFNIGITGLASFGGSSADDDVLETLQAGAHDPNRNGFTIQNVELFMNGTVDPYLDAQANIVFQIDRDGETVVELEEAFLTTRGLPAALQAKAGQFYTEFGRHNPQHPHVWAFVDQPVALSRFFGGDGLRNPGARLAWLTPAPWYSEVYVGLQNAHGETAVSFLSEPGEEVGGYTLIDRTNARGLDDLLLSARWLNGFDLSDTVSMNLGVSGLQGPNAAGEDTETEIYGADLYLKWQPLRATRGFPFVAWQTEWLVRDYATPDGGLKDSGGYTQLLWGYRPGWVAGLRGDYAAGKDTDGSDPFRDRRRRFSPNLTWYPTEYSKIRLQYNYDWAQHLNHHRADSVWLQYEFGLGAHAAHQF